MVCLVVVSKFCTPVEVLEQFVNNNENECKWMGNNDGCAVSLTKLKILLSYY